MMSIPQIHPIGFAVYNIHYMLSLKEQFIVSNQTFFDLSYPLRATVTALELTEHSAYCTFLFHCYTDPYNVQNIVHTKAGASASRTSLSVLHQPLHFYVHSM